MHLQIILLSDVENLGVIGDLVKVKRGYARNFLFPRGFAALASVRNVKRLEHEKRAAGARLARAKAEASTRVSALESLSLHIEKRSGEQGKLFGSVTSLDIERAVVAAGAQIDRRKLQFTDPIKTVGEYTVPLRVGAGVVAQLKVKVTGTVEPEAVAPAVAATAEQDDSQDTQ